MAVTGVAAGALVFVGAFLLDFVWARYTIALAQTRVWSSGLYAALIYIFNSSIVLAYVVDHWLLLPATIGAGAGAIVSVWMKKRGW